MTCTICRTPGGDPCGTCGWPAGTGRRLPTQTVKLITFSSSCWLWQGYVDQGGYAQTGSESVHRRLYRALIGAIPNGHELDHTCNVPRCVNPAHLEPVTPEEHCRRTVERRRERKTHCRNGHPFDEANTYFWRGTRYCRACNRAAVARRKERLRAEANPR